MDDGWTPVCHKDKQSAHSKRKRTNERKAWGLVQIGGSTRPARVRVLDLPFTAVEWLLPSDMLAAPGDPLTPAKWMVWDRSPLAKERSLTVSGHHLSPALLMPSSCICHALVMPWSSFRRCLCVFAFHTVSLDKPQ